jgi:hypothetical protein
LDLSSHKIAWLRIKNPFTLSSSTSLPFTMGAHASMIDSTNWDTADGRMTTTAATVSGCAPTTAVTELTCLPLKQLHLGTKYDWTVLPSEDAPVDAPLYEVVDSQMFHHGFHIKDSQGNIIMRVHAGTIYKFFIYT